MIFVWCTCVCINVYTCSVQVHEEARGRPLLWFLGHYWPLLHYWHSIYLVCVFRCIYHAINMVEEQKEQESGIRWQAFQLKDQPVTTSSIVRKKESAKTWTDSWEWTLLERLLLQRSLKDRPSTERQWLTPWKQQWVLGTGSWALHSQRRVSAEDNDRRVRYSSAALKWWFHKNCSS